MRRLLSCLARLIVLTSVCLSTQAVSQLSRPSTPNIDLLTELPVTSNESLQGSTETPIASAPSSTTNSISVPGYAKYKGVNEEMWDRIAEIGDPLNCRARVEEVSKSVTQQTLSACSGNCINDALNANDVVELRGGEYTISGTIYVGQDKILKGTLGERVIIRADGVSTGLEVDGGYSSNIEIQFAEEIGVKLRANALVHRVIVGNTGVNPTSNSAGFGIAMHGPESKNNCLVSVEAYNGFNEDGAGCESCYNGGNADGFTIKFGANNVTYIDSHAYQNSDDGYDFWKSGTPSDVPTIRIFYSSANLNGKHPTRSNSDGNGMKFGSSSDDYGARLVYGSEACDNLAVGFDRNLTTEAVEIFNSTAKGNYLDFYETDNEVISSDPNVLTCES